MQNAAAPGIRVPARGDTGPWLSSVYSSFLLSEPGVVTMTFSGVMIRAPFAVPAPLKSSLEASLLVECLCLPV